MRKPAQAEEECRGIRARSQKEKSQSRKTGFSLPENN
jgi:hypothetical protein